MTMADERELACRAARYCARRSLDVTAPRLAAVLGIEWVTRGGEMDDEKVWDRLADLLFRQTCRPDDDDDEIFTCSVCGTSVDFFDSRREVPGVYRYDKERGVERREVRFCPWCGSRVVR